MTAISWTSFTMNPARGEVEKAERLSLRGAATEEKVGSWMVYDAHLYNGPSITCNLCGDWDDGDAMSFVAAGKDTAKGGAAVAVSKEEQALINNNSGASATHNRWVEAWCNKLNLGPYDVFEFVYDCALTLYDCTSMEEGIEEGVKASGKIMADIIDPL
jgi:hypothetical protein